MSRTIDWSGGPVPCDGCQRLLRPRSHSPREPGWEGTIKVGRGRMCTTCTRKADVPPDPRPDITECVECGVPLAPPGVLASDLAGRHDIAARGSNGRCQLCYRARRRAEARLAAATTTTAAHVTTTPEGPAIEVAMPAADEHETLASAKAAAVGAAIEEIAAHCLRAVPGRVTVAHGLVPRFVVHLEPLDTTALAK